MAGGSFFSELRRRKVLQVAAIYGAVAWGVTEVVVTVTEQLFLPQWISTLSVIGFVVGFPVTMFLAWTFDITSDGIQRTEVSSRRGKASIALSALLLIAGTTGVFLLVKPAMQTADTAQDTPGVPPNSVAVLPFDNASRSQADAYLGEGLADELRDQLARVTALRIAARTSSAAARERGMDARTASESLGVAHLVEGSVRRQGRRLRVSVQLIEGRTGLALWSDSFERGTHELLAIQQSIAEEIVARVLPDATGIVTTPATRDADANELMLLAQHYEQQVRARQEVDVELLDRTIDLYREATEADPESALAHSRLARALLYSGDLESAEAPATQALELDPGLSEAHNTLGEIYYARGLPEAATAFRRAVELNPDNADALHNYAFWLWFSLGGKAPNLPESGELFRRALENDRLSLARYAALGDYLGKEGRVDEVRPVIESIETLFDDAESYRAIGWLYELIGEVDHAIAWTIRARDKEPDNPDHIHKLAGLFALLGDAETALELEPSPGIGVLYHLRRYDELIDIAEFAMIENPGDVQVRYLLAFAYVAKGAYEQAIHVLSSTDLPDSVLEDRARTIDETEAFLTLVNALTASGIPDAMDLGQSLARFHEDYEWWGDVGWVGLYRSCNFAILGNRERVLEFLPLINDSPRLRRAPELQDAWCFGPYKRSPVYIDVLEQQQARRAQLREKIPATLAEYGVSL